MEVTFVFDHRSIYAYLANSQMSALGAEIRYRPVDIRAVMRAVNNQPSPLCPPKTRYARVDALRWAKLYGIPLAPNEALLSALRQNDSMGDLLSRAALAAARLGIFAKVNDALFAAVWAGSEDLSTEEGRSLFCEKYGIPVTLWDDAHSDAVGAELESNTAWAIAHGVFGAPTFFVGEEMFFGNDRLDFVRERLEAARKETVQ